MEVVGRGLKAGPGAMLGALTQPSADPADQHPGAPDEQGDKHDEGDHDHACRRGHSWSPGVARNSLIMP